MKFNPDSLILGIVIGILSPIITFLGYYFINYSYMSAKEFYKFIQLANTAAPITSLCVIANLVVFFLFIQKEKYLTTRGILMSTFIYAGIVCYLKFFL